MFNLFKFRPATAVKSELQLAITKAQRLIDRKVKE